MDGIFVLYLEAYIELLISSYLAFIDQNETQLSGELISRYFSYYGLVVALIFIPIVTLLVIFMHKDWLKTDNCKESMGSLIPEIKIDTKF